MIKNGKTTYSKKKSFDGYCVGQGVEFPGIIVHAESDEDLQSEFLKILPGHKKALEKIPKDIKIEVLEIDNDR